ncbi:MAG TPA: hypothetical protein ENF75_04725 [Acidilobales archaeon]|nr:hypothetical protein [Acidilobales archaeon]
MLVVRHDLLIAGRGGQGILVLGYVLGLALVKYEGMYVVEMESYSAETRGGDSRVEMIVADTEEETYSLRIGKADMAILMYRDQVYNYAGMVRDNALVLIDSTFIDKAPKESWNTHLVPITKKTLDFLGTPRVANMVALGYFVKITKLASPESIIKSIKEVVKPEWVELNIKAFNLGFSLTD